MSTVVPFSFVCAAIMVHHISNEQLREGHIKLLVFSFFILLELHDEVNKNELVKR